MPHAHATVYIKPSMLRMDEIMGQTPLKDLDHIQLVLTWMPSRELYKLQVSVDHEMQSRAHKNLVELQQATKKREALEKFVSRPNLKLRRRKNVEMNWNEEWEKFLGNFQALHKEMNSQQQKRSTRLHRQLISIRRRSRISENRSDQQLHQ
jgi:hypothetical protein